MGDAVKKRDAGGKPGAELVFAFDGARGAVAPKLAAFLAGHHQVHEGRRKRVWAIGIGGVAASIAAGYFVFPVIGFFGVFFTIVAVSFAGDRAAKLGEGLDRGGDARHALVEMLDDIHPKARVRGRVDLTPASERQAYRTRTSPYSGSTKQDFRHRWFEVEAALVDGGWLAVELTSLEKVKGGSTIRRELQLRGRYRLPASAAPALRGEAVVQAPPPRLRGPATVPTCDAAGVGQVWVRPVARRDGTFDVVFWGRLEDPDQVPGVLARVGQKLGGRAATPGGGPVGPAGA